MVSDRGGTLCAMDHRYCIDNDNDCPICNVGITVQEKQHVGEDGGYGLSSEVLDRSDGNCLEAKEIGKACMKCGSRLNRIVVSTSIQVASHSLLVNLDGLELTRTIELQKGETASFLSCSAAQLCSAILFVILLS